MSRFYMTSVNSRGNTVSAAGRSSGQDCHLRGWRNGVEVEGKPQMREDGTYDAGRDEFTIHMTHGSGGFGRKIIGYVREDEDGVYFELSPYVTLEDGRLRLTA